MDPADRAAHHAVDVELRLPADTAYVAVLRTTTSALAARLDLTLDDVEDLRMAVGEAASLVLAEADDPAVLVCSFHLAPREVTVTLTVPSAAPTVPDRDGFAWQVLTTLATHAWVDAAAGSFGVRLTLASSVDRRPAVSGPPGSPGSPGSFDAPGESGASVLGAP